MAISLGGIGLCTGRERPAPARRVPVRQLQSPVLLLVLSGLPVPARGLCRAVAAVMGCQRR